jgi:hypothetical protein
VCGSFCGFMLRSAHCPKTIELTGWIPGGLIERLVDRGKIRSTHVSVQKVDIVLVLNKWRVLVTTKRR